MWTVISATGTQRTSLTIRLCSPYNHAGFLVVKVDYVFSVEMSY